MSCLFPRWLSPPRPAAAALAAALLCGHAVTLAQTAPPPAAAASANAALPKVVVSATRIEVSEDEVAATVTSKTAQEIERIQARDLKSLLASEAGISVRLQPARMSAVFGATGRGGNEGINIRGLEGNQVMLQTDGVRLPMAYDSGPYVAGRGDAIDIEAYKRVELLRGPSSTSYGSDGLAGAVSFLTKDPEDLLTLGQATQAAVKLGYSSADKSWLAVPSFALRSGDVQAMVLASLRRGHELRNRGDNNSLNWSRTTANPQDRESDYVLAKLLLKLGPAHQLKGTLEHLERQTVTAPIYSVVGMPLVNANIVDADAQEDIRRRMAKLDYQYSGTSADLFQLVSAHVYAQDSTNRQLGSERYNSPPAAWSRRDRDTRYGERSKGLGVQAQSTFGGAVAHRVLLGLDASASRITSLKDGAHYDAGGALIAGGFVPNQSFPDTDYRLLGLFVQDEIDFGSLTLVPALRWDRFELKPDVGNPLYTGNNRTVPATLKGDELSPRLGLVWRLAPLAQLFAQYGHGFRAPTPSQVNGGVTNPSANPPYRSIGNAELQPEVSDSVELGLRGREGGVRYSVAVYKARYRHFIDANVDVTDSTSVPLDPGMAPNTRTFQSINLRRVEIQGVELAAGWTFSRGWTVALSHAHAKGDTNSGDSETPLATIEPDKTVLKLEYERAGRYGGELALVAQKSQGRPHTAGRYIPSGYVVADLTAWWELSRQLQLNAALSNLGDKKYVLWSDVRGLALTDVALADAYTQPGRALSLSVRYQF